ncbi:MAG: penicillin-binding protein 2 [Mariprofundaceae bacterium]|nr:penicillin-binding protein 2 [Mariprofundaceae bacterium]
MSVFDTRSRFTFRMLVFHGIAALLLLLLLGRMVDLQWMQYDGLNLQAENNRINVLPILPVRGQIMDRNGRGLAVNRISYRLIMIPERIDDMDAVLAMLYANLPWSSSHRKRILRRISHARKDRPVLLQDQLQWYQIAWLLPRLQHYPGLNVEAGTHREYPYAALTSHVIGYLSRVRKSDLKEGFFPGEYIGRSGLELAFEAYLHGSPGSQQEEVDARGRRVAVLAETPPVMGKSIRLSLDVRIQQAAADALAGRTGAVVVMDVHSGEVLTMLSTPGYDTNAFIQGLKQQQWSAWLNNDQIPLLNRALQATYPPGSTWKMVTAMAGLRKEVKAVNQRVQCLGYVQLHDRRLRCWKRSGHGYVNLHDALMHSCDVFFYNLGDQLGMRPIIEEAHRWGFGEYTGITLSPEARGNLPAAGGHIRHGHRRAWFPGEVMITAIGQGMVTVTPLQMARFAAALANGGDVLKPQMLAGVAPKIERHVDLPAHALTRVQEAMADVANTPGGTAYRYLHDAAWHIAGKTGTAQVVGMSQKQKKYSSKGVLKKHQDHAWFIGYAPYEKPRISFAIFVEHGGHGSSGASPIAKAIVNAMASSDMSK